MEINFDKEYYISAACDKFGCDEIEPNLFFEAIDKAIDNTLADYTTNDNLIIEDWDMFDQDMYANMESELNKIQN